MNNENWMPYKLVKQLLLENKAETEAGFSVMLWKSFLCFV